MKILKKLIKKFWNKNFLKYAVIGLVLQIIFSTVLMYVGREIMGVNTAILTPIMVFLGFIIKYLLYDITGLLNKEGKK
jgi:hypothetical protein